MITHFDCMIAPFYHVNDVLHVATSILFEVLHNISNTITLPFSFLIRITRYSSITLLS